MLAESSRQGEINCVVVLFVGLLVFCSLETDTFLFPFLMRMLGLTVCVTIAHKWVKRLSATLLSGG